MSPPSPPRPQKYIAPNDLEYLLVVFLIRFAPRFSHALFADVLAWFAYRLSRPKRRAMEKNITCAFGNAGSAARTAEITRGSFHAFWQAMFAWSLPPLEVTAPRIRVDGMEHLYAGLARGKGVILWESGGFGERLLAKRILHARGFAIHQIHGSKNLGGFGVDNHPVTRVRARVRYFFDARELGFLAKTTYLPEDDSLAYTRVLLATLHANLILCATGDGREGYKHVRARFLGQFVPFATGMVSLARLADATLLLMFCWREEDGTVHLRLYPPPEYSQALDRYIIALEQEIRQRPHLYRNWHLVNADAEKL